MAKNTKTLAILLAAGSGQRFGSEIQKQFIELSGIPLIVYSLTTFEKSKQIDEIIVVSTSDYLDKVSEIVQQYKIMKPRKIVPGGKNRQDSSRIGVEHCGEDTDYVLIHDAVRPFITTSLLDTQIKSVKKYGAVVPTIPPTDTIIEVNKLGFIEKIPNRETLKRVQTPQAFKYKIIKRAHEQAVHKGIKNATDDCSLVLRLGHPVYTIKGDEKNIKVTFPGDFKIADAILKKQ